MLIGRGASLAIKDTSFDATPAGWCDHGRRNYQEGRGDYAAVERILETKGAAG